MLSSSSLPENAGFTLEKYFAEIGLNGFVVDNLSLHVLETIISHHLRRFKYNNEVLYLAGKLPAEQRQIPSLKIDEIFSLMVKRGGGYCFQQLELMHAVLLMIGFSVERYVARVVSQACLPALPDPDRPKTHELITVRLNEQRYIVDVGAAETSLRAPLALVEGEGIIGKDTYRLSKSDNTWSLDTLKNNTWFCMYRFFDVALKENDIDLAHNRLYLTPKHLAIRDDKILIAETLPHKRRYVTWYCDTGIGVFKSVKSGESEGKTIKFSSLEETKTFAQKKFGTL